MVQITKKVQKITTLYFVGRMVRYSEVPRWICIHVSIGHLAEVLDMYDVRNQFFWLLKTS